jgi:regulatory protein
MSKDENKPPPPKKLAAEIRVAAMNLLARREHCRTELIEKLQRRFENIEVIEQQLESLQAEGLQSDRRFLEAFVSARVSRLQGPLKIHQDLKHFDLPEAMVREVMDNAAIDWRELAMEAARRKFSGREVTAPRERDRARQFLYRRGFSSDDCVRAIEKIGREEFE